MARGADNCPHQPSGTLASPPSRLVLESLAVRTWLQSGEPWQPEQRHDHSMPWAASLGGGFCRLEPSLQGYSSTRAKSLLKYAATACHEVPRWQPAPPPRRTLGQVPPLPLFPHESPSPVSPHRRPAVARPGDKNCSRPLQCSPMVFVSQPNGFQITLPYMI